MKKFLSIILCTILILTTLTGCSIDFNHELENSYDTSNNISVTVNDSMATITPASLGNKYAIIPYDSYVFSDEDGDYNSSLLVNQTSSEVISCSNPHKRIYPASMTKIMTAMIVAEEIEAGRISMDDVVTLTHNIELNDVDAVSAGLSTGDSITVHELLYSLLIRSFNDCCVVLAEEIAGSESAFVDMMNQKAFELGATNTHFANSNGLHSVDHYTTTYDLYLMFNEFSKYKLLAEIDGISTYTMRYHHANGEEVEVECSATNGYLGEYDLPSGLNLHSWKTGTTTEAGSCLIMSVSDEDKNTYIAIIAKAIDKDTLYESMTSMLEQINE